MPSSAVTCASVAELICRANKELASLGVDFKKSLFVLVVGDLEYENICQWACSSTSKTGIALFTETFDNVQIARTHKETGIELCLIINSHETQAF